MRVAYRTRRAARVALALLFCSPALLAGGCSYDTDTVTGSIKTSAAPHNEDSDLRAGVDTLGARYDANPGDKAVSIDYARVLRELGRYDQAVAVMQAAAVKAPTDLDVLCAYGKALADSGQLEQAARVLANSYTPDDPNWSSLSAQGAVADRLGDHQAAQRFYQSALKIAPQEPSVLNNLGLSYALDKRLREAEQTLRQAAAQPSADDRVRANLALVLSLEGKFDEAERVAQHDVTRETAAANVAAVRNMIAQPNSWRQIESTVAKPARGDKADFAPTQRSSGPPAG
jgi:Flp pilus assembly protein TadD